MKRMHIRNLAPETKEDDLLQLFSQYGKVRALDLSRDIFTGRCRGFATVDMEGHEARAAIAGLDGQTFLGSAIRVNEDKPKIRGRARGR